ncbi:MAG TPA: alpha-isopropylmalate synthase regulatory domain-containing protein, partial [Euzebya sp.]|nr:alpha-isopropylmalate synthase regulatory domain-containing protein [Euzebya sp.]
WAVPYLPIDPKDVGRTYEAVIRVNSQSGKGGVAYIMRNEFQLDLPRRLQMEFSGVIQAHTEVQGGEVTPAQMWSSFEDEYLPHEKAPWGRFKVNGYTQESSSDGEDTLRVALFDAGEKVTIEGTGNGPINAFVNALRTRGMDVRVLDYSEHAMSSGGDATAAAYVECQFDDGTILWGVGIDANIVRASMKAIISAVNRRLGRTFGV